MLARIGNLTKGISDVGPLSGFVSSSLWVKIKCEIRRSKPEEIMSIKEIWHRNRVDQLAAAWGKLDIHQTEVLEPEFYPSRIGLIISSTVVGIHTLHKIDKPIEEHGTRSISAFAILSLRQTEEPGWWLLSLVSKVQVIQSSQLMP